MADFENLTRVHEHLLAEGWKVGIKPSTTYAHAKRGLIPRQQDGGYSQRDVDAYARTHLKRRDTGATVNDTETRLQEQKLREEIGRLAAVREMKELEVRQRRGELVEVEAIHQAWAGSALVLRHDLEHLAHEAPSQLIELSRGDPAAANEVTAYLLETFELMLDKYARVKSYRVTTG